MKLKKGKIIVNVPDGLEAEAFEAHAKGEEAINQFIERLEAKKGGMIKRKDGSYSRRGLWDNIRANRGSGRKPTKEMLKQEAKIRAKAGDGLKVGYTGPKSMAEAEAMIADGRLKVSEPNNDGAKALKYMLDATGVVYYPASLLGAVWDLTQGDINGAVAGAIPFGKGLQTIRAVGQLGKAAGGGKKAIRGATNLGLMHVGSQVKDTYDDVVTPIRTTKAVGGMLVGEETPQTNIVNLAQVPQGFFLNPEAYNYKTKPKVFVAPAPTEAERLANIGRNAAKGTTEPMVGLDDPIFNAALLGYGYATAPVRAFNKSIIPKNPAMSEPIGTVANIAKSKQLENYGIKTEMSGFVDPAFDYYQTGRHPNILGNKPLRKDLFTGSTDVPSFNRQLNEFRRSMVHGNYPIESNIKGPFNINKSTAVGSSDPKLTRFRSFEPEELGFSKNTIGPFGKTQLIPMYKEAPKFPGSETREILPVDAMNLYRTDYIPNKKGGAVTNWTSGKAVPWHTSTIGQKMGKGGYTVRRSSARKGKTHVVIGPDGTKKYFGDSKLGQHPKDAKRKKAFYARHAKNLKGNPYFRAFARATWDDGGKLSNNMYDLGIMPYDFGGPAHTNPSIYSGIPSHSTAYRMNAGGMLPSGLIDIPYGYETPAYNERYHMGPGGFLGGLKDFGLMTADQVTSIVNPDIIKSSSYSDTGFGKAMKGYSEVTGQTINKLAPMAATAIGGPAAGFGMSALQGASKQFVKPDEVAMQSTTGKIGSALGQVAGIGGMFYNPFGGASNAASGTTNAAGSGNMNPMQMMQMMQMMQGAGNAFGLYNKDGGYVKMADGGQSGLVPINVEGADFSEGSGPDARKGELLVINGKIIKNYVGRPPHPAEGQDPMGNDDAPEGLIVIPKNRTKEYLEAGLSKRKQMERSLISQQQDREMKKSKKMGDGGYYSFGMGEMGMAYGGPIGNPETIRSMMEWGGPDAYKKGGWIQKVTKSIKRRGTEGVCTGSKFGSSSCPPGSRRYNLAKTFRKMAKARKHEHGGFVDPVTGSHDIMYGQGGQLPESLLRTRMRASGASPEEINQYVTENYGYGGMAMYADGGKLPAGILRARMEASGKSDAAIQNYMDNYYAMGGNVNPNYSYGRGLVNKGFYEMGGPVNVDKSLVYRGMNERAMAKNGMITSMPMRMRYDVNSLVSFPSYADEPFNTRQPIEPIQKDWSGYSPEITARRMEREALISNALHPAYLNRVDPVNYTPTPYTPSSNRLARRAAANSYGYSTMPEDIRSQMYPSGAGVLQSYMGPSPEEIAAKQIPSLATLQSYGTPSPYSLDLANYYNLPAQESSLYTPTVPYRRPGDVGSNVSRMQDFMNAPEDSEYFQSLSQQMVGPEGETYSVAPNATNRDMRRMYRQMQGDITNRENTPSTFSNINKAAVLQDLAGLAPTLYNLGRFAFEKPALLKSEDYMTPEMKFRSTRFDETPYREATSRALYDSNMGLAGRTALASQMAQARSAGYMDWLNKEYLRRQGIDEANLGINARNKAMQLQIALQNQQAKARRMDFLGTGTEQFAQTFGRDPRYFAAIAGDKSAYRTPFSGWYDTGTNTNTNTDTASQKKTVPTFMTEEQLNKPFNLDYSTPKGGLSSWRRAGYNR